MKSIYLIILSLISFFSNAQELYKEEKTQSILQIDNKIFIDDYQDNLDSLLGSFKLSNDMPLNAKIFDIADKQVYSFLESSAQWKTHGEMMANLYYPKFFINDKPTSFCFVLYDSKSPLLEGYLRVLNYQEILDYLTFHEMGHCLEEYINHTTGKKISHNREDTELFADIFAMTNFLYLKKFSQAEKVVILNATADKKDYHYQPERLKKALEILKRKNINEIIGKPNVNKVLEISKDTFNSLKSNEINNPTFVNSGDFKIHPQIKETNTLSNFKIIKIQ